MSTNYRICGVPEEDLYVSKTKEEKEQIRKEMVKMALERGNKPTARYYNIYPATVRRWIKIYKEKGEI